MGGALPWAGRAAVLPFVALAALGVLQLVPLPPALLGWAAPGSADRWHPGEPAVAAVLGHVARPVSLHPRATGEALSWLLGLGALAALARPALREARFARAVVTGVVAGGLLVAVYGVVARLAFGPLLFGRIAVPTVSPFGPFVSKNHFAAYVSAATLLSLGLAVGLADAARRDRAWLSWVRSSQAAGVMVAFGAVVALALSVLVSQSRGGALGLLAGLGTFLALRVSASARHEARRQARKGVVAAGLALGGAVVLFGLSPPEARDRLLTAFGPPDTSGAFRLSLWRDAFRTFTASPLLGHGLGAFGDALLPHKTAGGLLRVEHAENELLELLVEGGLAATGPLGLGAVAVVGWTKAARRRHGLHRGLALGAAAALAGLLVHSLVDFPLRLPACAAVGVVAWALLAALGDDPAADRPQQGAAAGAPPRRAAVLSAALAGLVLALVFVSRAAHPPASASASDLASLRRARAEGGRALAPARASRAGAELRQHLQARPSDAEAWLHLAWLRARAGRHDEGLALARHAAHLDPQRPAIRDYLLEMERRSSR
jgi:O-antigen ligase